MAVSRKTVTLVAVIAIAFASVASYSLYKYLKGQEAKVQEVMKVSVTAQKVVVAAKNIPVGEAITSAQVKTVDWPTESLPAGTFAMENEVVGRTTLQTIETGNPVTVSKLLPVGGLPGVMNYKIPEGHRAMTVGVDQVSGVAGFITPNSMVDVVLTAKPPGYRQSVSRIVMQNIPVLATGQVIEQKDGKPVLVPTVTLDVTPEEAERLVMANSSGSLRLLLRRAGDSDVAKTRGATVTKVVQSAGQVRRTTAVASAKKAPKAATYRKRPATTVARKAGPHMITISVEVYRNNVKTVEGPFKVKEDAL
jgi:pilus assembly protein CpaB